MSLTLKIKYGKRYWQYFTFKKILMAYGFNKQLQLSRNMSYINLLFPHSIYK